MSHLLLPPYYRNQLKGLIKERSIIIHDKPDIVLKSKKKSNFYADMRSSTSGVTGNLIAAGLLDLLDPLTADINIDYLAAVVRGGIPVKDAILSTIQRLQGHDLKVGFAERNPKLDSFWVNPGEAKDHGVSNGSIEALPQGHSIVGKNVFTVEDTVTTMKSALGGVEAAQAAGANVIGVISVFDRGDDTAGKFAAKGLRYASLFHVSEFLEPGVVVEVVD